MFYVLLATRARAARARRASPAQPSRNLATLLDLVALGTVADVVRLDRVNRTLVAQGLARIRAGRAQPGVDALFAAAGRDPRARDGVRPGLRRRPAAQRRRAARRHDASASAACSPTTAATALPLAAELDRLNRERREVEATMQDEALADLEAPRRRGAGDAYTLCLYRPEWHQGVVGIVASRLKDRFHRPAIVFAPRQRRRAQGLGALDRRLPPARRARPRRQARAGPDRALRRPRVRRRADARRGRRCRGFARAFEAVAREQLSPARARARARNRRRRSRPASSTLELARALRDARLGPGLPAAGVRRHVRRPRAAHRRRRALASSRSRRGRRALRRRSCSATPSRCPARIRAAYRPDVNEWQRQRSRCSCVIEHWQPAVTPDAPRPCAPAARRVAARRPASSARLPIGAATAGRKPLILMLINSRPIDRSPIRA